MWDERSLLFGLLVLIAIAAVLTIYSINLIIYAINKRIIKSYFNGYVLAIMQEEDLSFHYNIKVCTKSGYFRYFLCLNDKEIEIYAGNASQGIRDAFVSQGFVLKSNS